MKAWALSCEANYGHKFHILHGLIYCIEGNDSLALKEYKTAINFAKKHEYILEEAIANELSAAIWRKTQDEQYEQIHLIEAHYCYRSDKQNLRRKTPVYVQRQKKKSGCSNWKPKQKQNPTRF